MTHNKTMFGIFTQPIDQIYEGEEEIINLSIDLSCNFEFFSLNENEEEYLKVKECSQSEKIFECVKTSKICSGGRVKIKPKNHKNKFKYILQPKWEETISKMKTLWFLSAKNRIITSLNMLSEVSAKFVDYLKVGSANEMSREAKQD